MLLAEGWPAHSRPRRTRKPADQQHVDPRKTVKPTPRGKHGLPPRTERLPQLHQGELSVSCRSTRTPSYNNFYQRLAAGTWHGLPSNKQQHTRQLFPCNAAATPGLKRKVCPALNTTQNWARLQRKVLPKYLLVLDDEIGLLLLKSLARLQPPVAAANSAGTLDFSAANISSNPVLQGEITGTSTLFKTEQLQHIRAMQQHQQQHPAPRRLLMAEQVPTSITGALQSRLKGQSATGCTHSSAAHGASAAISRGFADAIDERDQFELMLIAVYAVFQHKLQLWAARRLAKAIGYVAHLQIYHDGFMQAWFAATAPTLQHQPMPYLAVCLEALARLSAPVPDTWLASFAAASQGRLGQLTLPQQALLQMHIADLQMQLPSKWWQELYECTLQHAAAQLATMIDTDIAAAFSSHNGQWQAAGLGSSVQQHKEQQANKSRELRLPGQLISRPAADALCGMLWSRSRLQGQLLQQHHQQLLGFASLLLPAVSANRCSAGAMVQLLHACSLGSCRKLPLACDVCVACLDRLQPRLSKVCTGGALQLLIESLSLPSVQQQLPQGWCVSLEEALMPNLRLLPTQLLLHVAKAFAECRHKPGAGFMSAFVLATFERLESMSSRQILALVDSCASMQVVMPNMWTATVLQQLQQHCTISKQASVDSQESTVALRSDITERDVKQAVERLTKISAIWTATQDVCGSVLQDLQQVVDSTNCDTDVLSYDP